MALGAAAARRAPILDRIGEWSLIARPDWMGWMIAVVVTLVAVGARLAIDDVLPVGVPFVTFFPAILVAAFFAGTREGALVAAACGLVAWYAFIPPFYSFSILPSMLVAVGLYVFVASTELLLVHLMRRALRRLALAEAASREQARLRGLMFAELQHRVSNNLSVVAALLGMQRRELRDPAAIRALDEAGQRIGVVARLSRQLHDPEAQAVDFGAFLSRMVPDAVASAGAEERVEVTLDAGAVMVTADQAIPLGLIASELIVNAIEHGYPDGRAGRVEVRLEARDGTARLTVTDHGVGLPPDFDLAASPSLGLGIARQFANALGGRLGMAGRGGVGQGGAVSSLDFPVAAVA